jgi:hypothetical protein
MIGSGCRRVHCGRPPSASFGVPKRDNLWESLMSDKRVADAMASLKGELRPQSMLYRLIPLQIARDNGTSTQWPTPSRLASGSLYMTPRHRKPRSSKSAQKIIQRDEWLQLTCDLVSFLFTVLTAIGTRLGHPKEQTIWIRILASRSLAK